MGQRIQINSKGKILRSAAWAVLMAGNLVWAQSTSRPQDRLRAEITDSERVTLSGNVHPAVAQAASVASVDASFPMEHMILLLQPDAAQQVELDQLVAQQQNPQSPLYHKFLTPEQFAERFGATQNDIEKITGWLRYRGFQVEEVTPNHLSIVFSGDAHAVETAFHTEVKQYSVNGEIHHANASDPTIPVALAGVVKGVVKLHDFQSRSFANSLRITATEAGQRPDYTVSSSIHYLAPADWAMIYNVHPMYSSNLTGSGQSIAVIGRSNVNMSDIQSFRSQFGLPSSTPTVIVAQGSNPGVLNNGDTMESTLDVEWAGAIAPAAQVKFVISGSTATADGIDLAAMYAVNHNVAPVISVSYGACEAEMGQASGANGSGTALAFYNALWQQAAAQGISVFVSSGDSGAAGCEGSAASQGSQRAINGMCSSPYATCVGGTQFNEGANTSLYWLPGNNAVIGTAQSYIPEVVWNQSGSNGGSGLAGSGGGVSIAWTKPAWQTGPGVPADGYRDVPDVSFSASTHDGYLVYYGGSLTVVGGTSAAAPSFASLFTLINQKYAASQGCANPVLYPLAIKQSQGGALVFHDITSGNNTVPGVAGFSAAAGYDQASGLGSVDALQLVNHWGDVSLSGTFALTAGTATATMTAGQNATFGLSVAVSNGFNWPVAFKVSGAPTGVTPTFSVPTIAAPGTGTTSLQLAANSTVPAGTYTITVTASGGTVSKTATLTLTVNAIVPKCTLTANPASVSLTVAQATNVRLTCTAPQGALPATLSLAVSGQPTGVNATFSAATLVPGSGTTSMTVSSSTTAQTGTYSLAVTASGGSFSQTINVPLTLSIPPSISLTLASSSLTVVQGTAGTVGVTIADVGTFNSATNLTLSGLPIGMTGSFSPASFVAPGAGTSTLTLKPGTNTPPGKYNINVIGSGGGLVASVPIAVSVTAAPNFTLSAAVSATSVQMGQPNVSVSYTVASLTAGFNAPVAFAVTGLPLGVTGTFSNASLAAPGNGSTNLALSAGTSATPGQYRLTVTASGGTVTQTATLVLTVIGLPGFTLKTDVTTLPLTAGGTFTTTISLVAQNGFNSPVTLSLGSLPAGITASFSSSTIATANGTALLTVQTSSTMTNGTYSIPISGSSSVIATPLPGQSAAVKVIVGTVSTSLSASTLTVTRGSSAMITVSTTAANFGGTVVLSAAGNPTFVSYSFSPTSIAGSGTSTLKVNATASATVGTFTLSIHTGAGGTTTTTPLTVTIR